MADLLAEIRCVRREIELRSRVYPNWVERGKMSQANADHEIKTMKAVLARLESMVDHMGAG